MGGTASVVQAFVRGGAVKGIGASAALNGVAQGARQIYRPPGSGRGYSVSAGERAGAFMSAASLRRQFNCRQTALVPTAFGIAERTVAAWLPTSARGTHDVRNGGVESDTRASQPGNSRQAAPAPSVDTQERSLSVWRRQNTQLACRSQVVDSLAAPGTQKVQAAAVVQAGGGKGARTADIAFIGGGNMAKSLLRGLIDAGHDAGRLAVSDPNADCRAEIEALGARAVAHNQQAADCANTVVLAVKPQVLAGVLAGMSIPGESLIVSVCAGVPVDGIANLTSKDQAIVRCMPNTASLLRAGITALYANANTDENGRQAAEKILSAVGETLWVDTEAELDTVTAVSGSGPAYFFYLMEAMAKAGESLGLDPEVAARLTVETAWGAARMARETGTAPSTLRRNVTSPGGTTEAAINTLNEGDVNDKVVEALGRARQRAREIADGFGSK